MKEVIYNLYIALMARLQQFLGASFKID